MDLQREVERLQSRVAEAERHAEEARRLMELSERERRWIALEIHDGLAQELAGATMFLDAAQAQIPDEATSARDSLAVAGQLVRDALTEARRLMEGIRPPVLEAEGLAAAVRQLVEQHRERYALPVELQLEVASQRFPPTLEMAVFRIVQEGLTNAQRHSQASQIQIVLRQDAKGLHIRLEDDGVGFDLAQVPLDRHGVRGIQERADLAGGRASIDSSPGKGTRILVELPLDDQLLAVAE